MSEKKITADELEIESEELEGISGGRGAYCKTANTLMSMATGNVLKQSNCGTWAASMGVFRPTLLQDEEEPRQEEPETHETNYIS